MNDYLIYGVVLLSSELIYFKLAKRFNIIAKPNDRSSHSSITIRGGGIVFIIGIGLWFINSGFQWPYFFAGAAVLAVISFMDDLGSLPALVRFFVQLISILFLFYQAEILDWNVMLLLTACIVSIGTLNAYNFMDGINGITGINALIYLGTCWCINVYFAGFTNTDLLIALVLSVGVFLFFNFRKKAACFAGDVGSITLAFVQVFFLLQLIQKTGFFLWAGMFLVFGLDSVITIIY